MISKELQYFIESGNVQDITATMLEGESRNQAFKFAAEKGYFPAVMHLIKLTKDPIEQQNMLHFNGGSILAKVAGEGHFLIFNSIIDLINDADVLEDVIHSFGDMPFTLAAEKGYATIMNRLIELTPDIQKQRDMLHALDGRAAFENQRSATFLAIISTDDDIFRRAEISGPLNEEAISKLKELRTSLIESFSDGSNDENAATAKSNSAMAVLLEKNNLRNIGRYFTAQATSSEPKNIFSALLELSEIENFGDLSVRSEIANMSEIQVPSLSIIEHQKLYNNLGKIFTNQETISAVRQRNISRPTTNPVQNSAIALSTESQSRNL